jgi:hypothetical protein
MRRVSVRVGDISGSGEATAAEREAAARAEAALRASPDSRDRHRAAVRALSRAGELVRALELAEAWFARDRLDPEALAARADLSARLGHEDEALRLLSGTVDLRPDDATLHERLAAAYERAGERERACAHRVALAEIDPSGARLGAAMRCERALGRAPYAEALLASVGDERVRREAERTAAEPGPAPRDRGDLTVEASWSGGDDVSISLVTADGTRLSWMGGRTTVVGRDARVAGRELVGLSRAAVGSYLVEVVRTDPSTLDRAVAGELRVRAIDARETLRFTLGAGESRRVVGRVAVRRETRLEAVR